MVHGEVEGSNRHPRGLDILHRLWPGGYEWVSEVFPNAEHRECMYHLVHNFKKRYSGKVFDDHL